MMLTKKKGIQILLKSMKYKQIDPSWEKIFKKEQKKDYFFNLSHFLKEERKKKNIFPQEDKTFAAFSGLPLKKVKVVILGQDPYHTPEMACGLAFCVDEQKHKKLPPSLKNIYKEIKSDTQDEPRPLNELKKEGVLFLNTVLSVEEGKAFSHRNRGWERFTDSILRALWEGEKKIVFLLWGKAAKRKGEELFIGEKGHLVLIAGHPSPLSARYFFGCKHFTKANAFLKKERDEHINWTKR
ncbi:MAG: Uracil-DNA glycosylase [Chlamydiia bacterium]|nr:Uracil-DNA glycosylase [Chlamydiia bacterium]